MQIRTKGRNRFRLISGMPINAMFIGMSTRHLFRILRKNEVTDTLVVWDYTDMRQREYTLSGSRGRIVNFTENTVFEVR
jgi:hypothetical protein